MEKIIKGTRPNNLANNFSRALLTVELSGVDFYYSTRDKAYL